MFNKIKKIGMFVCGVLMGGVIFCQSYFAQKGFIFVKYNGQEEAVACDDTEPVGHVLIRSKLLEGKKTMILSNRSENVILPAFSVAFYGLLNGSVYAYDSERKVEVQSFAFSGMSGLVRNRECKTMIQTANKSILAKNNYFFSRVKVSKGKLLPYEENKLSRLMRSESSKKMALGEYTIYSDEKDIIAYKDDSSPIPIISTRRGINMEDKILPCELLTFDFTTADKIAAISQQANNNRSSDSMPHLPVNSLNSSVSGNKSSKSMGRINWDGRKK